MRMRAGVVSHFCVTRVAIYSDAVFSFPLSGGGRHHLGWCSDPGLGAVSGLCPHQTLVCTWQCVGGGGRGKETKLG